VCVLQLPTKEASKQFCCLPAFLLVRAVLQTLPTDPAQARRNLVAIEQELTQMDKEHKQLRSTARRWPRFWLWAGFAALSFQVNTPGLADKTAWQLGNLLCVAVHRNMAVVG
jgi:hypothetical protein